MPRIAAASPTPPQPPAPTAASPYPRASVVENRDAKTALLIFLNGVTISYMLHELATAGPVFWLIAALLALFIVGTTMEKLRKRKLEIDLQKKLDRDAEK